ncbi:MAG: ATP-binding cassette domain-containing protein [Clostridiales bacterium]|jgi:D-methionine transport system ATP-binding protein|nr:ATP-binding cassette domain-containing protein [Clostridiales bacterium]
MITLENVCKTFDAKEGKVEAVRDVSLNIKQSEIFGIIGFSGAGKSTLVRCINLLERPTSGRVYIDGIELTGLSEHELRQARRRIGMIFQQFNLFASRTVFQNIAYPLRRGGLTSKGIGDKVHELLELVDLSDKETAYPSQLSGGQKQRVAIARALANDPNLLLCDEATSALDPQTTLSILKLLKKLNIQLGLTIVVITHEMSVVKEICDKVAVMENGFVVEQGEVFSIFANPKTHISQDFIDTTTNLSKINSLIEEKNAITSLKPGECVLKFRYLEKNAAEALVSTISRRFNIDVNIIFANLDWISGAPLGGLVSVVSGDRRGIDAAIEYLESKNVEVEVILDARADVENHTKCYGEA